MTGLTAATNGEITMTVNRWSLKMHSKCTSIVVMIESVLKVRMGRLLGIKS